ncbi:hypothetical protein A9Q99_11965 [Gammaproteobacteria bacterium 45_16_T64]|nr:hypothetical protein A9Q99_11965 [Gammaproteobacteria bacterium 45_16_T64]
MANVSRFSFTLIGHQDNFLVTEFSGQESLSCPFEWRITVATENADLDLHQLTNSSALLTLRGEEATPTERFAHGFVSTAKYIESGTYYSLYELTLQPQLSNFNHRSGHRIFQDQTVQDIINTLFSDARIPSDQYQWKLSKRYPKRSYCAQYGESELAFISRLLAEEGIHYHFTHHKDRHVIVLSDNNNAFAACPKPQLPYIQEQSRAFGETSAYRFALNRNITASQSSLIDFTFQAPKNPLIANGKGSASHKHFTSYPSLYQQESVGKQYANLRLQQLQALQEHATASTNRLLTSGTRFELSSQQHSSWNQDYLIIDIEHKGTQSHSLEAYAASQACTYNNTLTAIPSNIPFRPSLDQLTQPAAHGTSPAIVTGPPGEEIYTDEHGRVKVQFPWDRLGSSNETSSCWLRVKQGWAGIEYGAMSIPRIGQEVIVSYENSNPDRPLITGRVYNGQNKAPYALPANKTRTLLKTKSSLRGSGFNEFRIEDKKGQEQVFIHGEKDMDIHIKNDKKTLIKNNRHATISGSQYQQTTKLSQTIGGEHNEKAGKQFTLSINKDTNIKISGASAVQAGNSIYLKSGMKAMLSAGQQLVLKAGAGTVVLDPSGVSITGPMVMINEGGGGGAAMPPMIIPPTAPVEADKNKAGQNFTPASSSVPPLPPRDAARRQAAAQAITFRMASKTNAPIVSIPSPPSSGNSSSASNDSSNTKTKTTSPAVLAPAPLVTDSKAKEEKNWLQLQLNWDDKHKTPIRNQEYTLHLADGSSRTGTLDAKGQAFEENLPAGTIAVNYTNNPAATTKLQSLKEQLSTSLKNIIIQAQEDTEMQAWVSTSIPAKENGWVYTQAAIDNGWSIATNLSSFASLSTRGLYKSGSSYLDLMEDISTGNIREIQRKLEDANTAGAIQYTPASEAAEAINVMMRDQTIRQLLADFPEDFWDTLADYDITENLAPLVNEVFISIFGMGINTSIITPTLSGAMNTAVQEAGTLLADITKGLKDAGQAHKQKSTSNSIVTEKIRKQAETIKNIKVREHFILQLANKKGTPWSNKPFKLTTESGVISGKVNAQGVLKTKINEQDLNGKVDIWLKDNDPQPTFSVDFAVEAGELPDVNTIQGVQTRCNNLGFNAGVVDGINGSKTTTAVTGFQRLHGLDADGIPGPITKKKLSEEYRQ